MDSCRAGLGVGLRISSGCYQDGVAGMRDAEGAVEGRARPVRTVPRASFVAAVGGEPDAVRRRFRVRAGRERCRVRGAGEKQCGEREAGEHRESPCSGEHHHPRDPNNGPAQGSTRRIRSVSLAAIPQILFLTPDD